MMAKSALKRTQPFCRIPNCDFRLYTSSSVSDIINDPVQLVFAAKLREYKEKSKNGEMVEPTDEMVREYNTELERVNKTYGGDGKSDLTKFPEFKFPDVQLDPIVSDNTKKT